MKKREAAFQVKFKHYLEENPPKTSTAYELKYVEKGKFNIGQWVKRQPHQLRGLLQSSTPGDFCYHKMSDMSMTQSPYDCFVMTGADAFLVIFFKEYDSMIFVSAVKALSLTKTYKTISFGELSGMSPPCSL